MASELHKRAIFMEFGFESQLMKQKTIVETDTCLSNTFNSGHLFMLSFFSCHI